VGFARATTRRAIGRRYRRRRAAWPATNYIELQLDGATPMAIRVVAAAEA
jgi:hypothetical protein